MFNLFKKKSPIDLLNARYHKVMQEAYTLSKTNRAKSDGKYEEAAALADEILELEKQQK